MAIVGSELKWYQSKVVNDTTSNGGRISTNQITSGLSNSWWPNYTESQLAAGATQWRKSFLRIDNATDTIGYNCRIGLKTPTEGADKLYLAKGTHTDIQSGTGSLALYGAGKLNAGVVAGTSTVTVLVEDGAVVIFRPTELIRISDQVLSVVGGVVTVTSGNAEVKVIDTVNTVGSVTTLTLTSALSYDFSATNTYISSLIEESTVTGTTTDKVVTSTAGTFTEANMTVGNLGSLYQTLTFTFSSASAFTVTSDEVTLSPSTGSISSTYAPTNVSVGAAYFSVDPSCWGGTFANGDTVVITTVPPCIPVWEKRIVGAGTGAIASQVRTLMTFVDS